MTLPPNRNIWDGCLAVERPIRRGNETVMVVSITNAQSLCLF